MEKYELLIQIRKQNHVSRLITVYIKNKEESNY